MYIYIYTVYTYTYTVADFVKTSKHLQEKICF